MDKYISVYEPLGDGTRDRGEKHYGLLFGKEGIRKCTGIGSHITVEEFPLSEIVSMDCFRGDELQNNMASGAGAGLLIGGVRGAIVGGMLTSGQTKAWWLEIELKDQSVRYFRLSRDSDNDVFLKWANKHDVKVRAARALETSTAETGTDSADEIRKYKELCDDGIITEEEFEAKKKQLLGL